jgi:RNA-directed DNA polymerase
MIPKAGGGERPLGLPTIKDRIIQTAATLVLESCPGKTFKPKESIFEADTEKLKLVKFGATAILPARVR